MSVGLKHWLFTVEDYHRMGEVGILSEDDRVELLEGEIVQMIPIGSRHASCVGRFTHQLISRFRSKAIVFPQNPINIDNHSEPQPDISVLRNRKDFYADSHPTPDDILLVVEVMDSSVDIDRHVKLPLYAQAGIPEVWLVDLEQRCIEKYVQPEQKQYQTMKRFDRQDEITTESFPDIHFKVVDLIG